jgi:histidinol dehydrogenase
MPKFLKSMAEATGSSGNDPGNVAAIVSSVIQDIRTSGDVAVRSYSEKFDKWSPASFKLSKEEIEKIVRDVPAQVIEDIKEVQNNVRTFAEAQRKSLGEFELEIQPGVFLGQKNLPINFVGA